MTKDFLSKRRVSTNTICLGYLLMFKVLFSPLYNYGDQWQP